MLLKLQPEHEVAVIEMGMSHALEITALAKIAQPEVGVVTVVAPVHWNTSSRWRLSRARSTNSSNPATWRHRGPQCRRRIRLAIRARFQRQVVLYGQHASADIRAENINPAVPKGRASTWSSTAPATPLLPLVGVHNVSNALAAIAVALDRGIRLAEAAAALATLKAADKRGQVVQLGNIRVINGATIRIKSARRDGGRAGDHAAQRRIVCRRNAGTWTCRSEMHAAAGRHIAGTNVDRRTRRAGLGAAPCGCGKAASAPNSYRVRKKPANGSRATRDGDVVLLKASRGVKLEKALEKWTEISG